MTLHRPGPRCYCQNNETGNVLFNFILCIVHSGATLHLQGVESKPQAARRDIEISASFQSNGPVLLLVFINTRDGGEQFQKELKSVRQKGFPDFQIKS